MVISKKMKIIGFSMLGVAITTIAIVVPLSLKKSDDKKSSSVREKFVDLTKKEIVINENSDLNLSTLANQTKVINEIKKRVSFLNKKQKDSIKIKTKTGSISYKEALKIEILITLDKKEETFLFKFKRITNNYDRFVELSHQKQILSNEISNLDLSNASKRDIVKKHLQKQASFLTDQEKNSIKVITNNKTITDLFIKVEIKATFFKIEQDFFFNFSRKESNAEKSKNKKLFDSLKAKFDQVNLTQTLTNQVDLDLSNNPTNQNIVKDFIVGLINAIRNVVNVTNEEKKGILIDSQVIITHTNAKNVNISITFGANTKTYIFKLTRTKSQNEIDRDQVATIKAKITDKNLTIDRDVDTSDDAKILAAIKVQLKIDNPSLSNNDLLKITDNISAITSGNNNVILKITVGEQSDIVNIIIIKSTKSNQELVNNINIKLKNINKSTIYEIPSNDDIVVDNFIKGESWKKVSKFIFSIIDKANPGNELTNEEKKYLYIFNVGKISKKKINYSFTFLIKKSILWGANASSDTIYIWILRKET